MLRNESKARCSEQVFGGTRLFSGSGRESSVSQLNPLAAVTETGQVSPAKNYASEADSAKAKALVYLGNLSRHMM